jgi:hypothetical protein
LGVATQTVNVLPKTPSVVPGGSSVVPWTPPVQPGVPEGTKVTFVCTSLSASLNGETVNNALPSEYGISCTSPTIALTGSPTQVNVTIQTSTSIVLAAAAGGRGRLATSLGAVIFPLPGLALLGLGALSRRSGRKRRGQLLAMVGLIAILWCGVTSCGGSFTPPPVAATPTGQYYVTVVETVVNPPAPTGFVQTSLIVPLPVTASGNSGGN